MKMYDLSQPLNERSSFWPYYPPFEVKYIKRKAEHGVNAQYIMTSNHMGTHLDAPYHFYPTSEGRPARHIDEVPLEWCIGDGVLLDFRRKKPPEVIPEYDIASELERIQYNPKKGDIVIVHTGGTDHYDTDPCFSESATGMNGGALNYIFRFGVKIMATDSHTIDMPIPLMTERFLKGEKESYFPIHRAGRYTEWTHAEKLANLASLPGPLGFKIMFFPVKVARATGAWIHDLAHGIDPVAERLPELDSTIGERIVRNGALRLFSDCGTFGGHNCDVVQNLKADGRPWLNAEDPRCRTSDLERVPQRLTRNLCGPSTGSRGLLCRSHCHRARRTHSTGHSRSPSIPSGSPYLAETCRPVEIERTNQPKS